MERAKMYCINIPEPICVSEITDSDFQIDTSNILVDEALLVLNNLLNSGRKHYNIIGCTLSDEDNAEKVMAWSSKHDKNEIITIEDFISNL